MLTEQQLADLDQWAACDLDRKTGAEVCALIDELRARRQADLTPEEVEAIREVYNVVKPNDFGMPGMVSPAALAVLAKLLSRKEGGL